MSPRSYRLRTQVALLFGLLIGCVAAALSWGLAERHARSALRDQGDTLQTLARSTATVFADGLFERQREIDLISADPSHLRDSRIDAAHWAGLIHRLQVARREYSWIGVTDPVGLVQVATRNLLLGKDVSARPWFQAAQKQSFTGDVHEAKLLATLLPPTLSDEPIRFLDFAAPLRDGHGELQGVLGVHASWEWAAQVIAALRSPAQKEHGVRVFIIDRQGHLIHRPRDVADALAPRPNQSADGQPARVARWSDGQDYLSAWARLPAFSPTTDLGWTIIVRQPIETARAAAQEDFRTFLLHGALATVLQAQLRVTDFLARFGGEEFLVLMPETAPEAALQVAEKLRRAVEDSEGPPTKVTLSLGLCCPAERQPDPAAALQAADEALYAAKQGGRNRAMKAPSD